MSRALTMVPVLMLVAAAAQAQPRVVETRGSVRVVDGGAVDAAADAVVGEPIEVPGEVPSDLGEAAKLTKDTFKAGKAGNWWLMSAGIIWLLMFGAKLTGLFKRMGKRWAYITVGVLSVAAALLAKFGGGVSWEAAFAVLTSGPVMAFANDLWKRGILGKEPETKVKV